MLLEVIILPCLLSSPLKRMKTLSTYARRTEKGQFSNPELLIDEVGVNNLMPELLHQTDSNTTPGRHSRVGQTIDAYITELPRNKSASQPQQTERVEKSKKTATKSQREHNGFETPRSRVRRQSSSAPHCVKRPRYFDLNALMLVVECIKTPSCASVTCSYQTASGSQAIAVIDCVDASNSTGVTKACT